MNPVIYEFPHCATVASNNFTATFWARTCSPSVLAAWDSAYCSEQLVRPPEESGVQRRAHENQNLVASFSPYTDVAGTECVPA